MHLIIVKELCKVPGVVTFCAAHENQFENKCRVRECTNDRLPVSQACELHKPEWDRYVYQHSRQNLAEIKQKLQKIWNGIQQL